MSASFYFAIFTLLTLLYIYIIRNRSYEANLVFKSAKEIYHRFT